MRVLDRFTELEAKLRTEVEAELELRRKQYQHYRNVLLVPEGKEVEWKALKDLGEFIRGKRFTKSDFVEDGIEAIHYGEIYTRYGVSQSR